MHQKETTAAARPAAPSLLSERLSIPESAGLGLANALGRDPTAGMDTISRLIQASPGHARDLLLRMQGSLGNGHVQRVLADARRRADDAKVVPSAAAADSSLSAAGPVVGQRVCTACEKEKDGAGDVPVKVAPERAGDLDEKEEDAEDRRTSSASERASDNEETRAGPLAKSDSVRRGSREFRPRRSAADRLHALDVDAGVPPAPAFTYTFLSRGSYGETAANFTRPSLAPTATGSTIAAGTAAPNVTVFPTGTYQVMRNDGVVKSASCPRSAAGLIATRAHENSHANGARAAVAAANTANALPQSYASLPLGTAALPGIQAAWNASVDAAWNNEITHGPSTNPPTAQTFTQENAAGTCTFT